MYWASDETRRPASATQSNQPEHMTVASVCVPSPQRPAGLVRAARDWRGREGLANAELRAVAVNRRQRRPDPPVSTSDRCLALLPMQTQDVETMLF